MSFTVRRADGWSRWTRAHRDWPAAASLMDLTRADLAAWQPGHDGDGPPEAVLFVPLGLNLVVLIRRVLVSLSAGRPP